MSLFSRSMESRLSERGGSRIADAWHMLTHVYPTASYVRRSRAMCQLWCA